jgi:protein-S-isoprenylcysteine O-methyltransferase Ste14
MKEHRDIALVIAQMCLLGLYLTAPRLTGDLVLPFPLRWAGSAAGLIGLVLFLGGLWNLGRQLTPWPRPRTGGKLVTSGVYGWVRHPLYGGGLMGLAGWAITCSHLPRLGVTLALWGVFELKIRREERWLNEVYPEYSAYRKRVRKLIPFVY